MAPRQRHVVSSMARTINGIRISLLALGVGAIVWACFYSTDSDLSVSVGEATQVPASGQDIPPVRSPSDRSPLPDAPLVSTSVTPSPETVRHLIQTATADDAGARADAIDALAAAPGSAAVPVLQKVLGDGDDIERQLALSSLHALALREGDVAGAIRETLRQAVYDGGDEAVASGAQAVLDDIERGDESHAVKAEPVSGDR